MIEGRKAVGKTTFAAALAASMTGGPCVPGWTGPRNKRVFWFASEDRWESEILPRLSAAGAPLEMIGRILPLQIAGRMRRMVLPDDIEELSSRVLACNVGMLVLDPYISLANRMLDMRVEQQVRSYFEPLADLSWRADCLSLCTRHLRKGTSGDAREHGLGSVAVSNVARAVLRCDEHPHERDHFVVSVVATNAGRPARSQCYTFQETDNGCPCIEWRGAVDLDADTIAEGKGSAAERDEWHDADRVLIDVVGYTWTRTKEVLADAANAGVSEKSLRRAKARLGVRSRRVVLSGEAFWQWGPPRHGWPEELEQKGGAYTDAGMLGILDQDGPQKASDPPGDSARRTRRTRVHARTPQPPNVATEETDNGK